jgi:hypothetical protein
MLESIVGRFINRRCPDLDSGRRRNVGLGQPGSESTTIRQPDWLEHHTPLEHAELLLVWIQQNVDLSRGQLFREAVQEFYVEAITEARWAGRPWNPIARQLDLICTGGRKPYASASTATGRMKRRRYYPVPAAY